MELIGVVIILVFVVIVMAFKMRELYREKQLHRWVSWIMVSNALWTYISDAQHELGINKEYRISYEQEWDIVKEILEEFQSYTAQSYFKGCLKTIKSKYEISGEHYFMLLLQSFLREHECDNKFLDYDMHKKRICYKEYGSDQSWNRPYDATYTLTDFAIIYHKLYYVSHVYCKNCQSINESEMRPVDHEKDIEETLDTQQIQISRF